MSATSTLASRPKRRVGAFSVLTKGNTKLGPAIASYSLPAVTTCPGATPACSLKCYATRGLYVMPSNIGRLEQMLEFSRTVGFAADMTAAVAAAGRKTVRIHASGDFDSPEAVERWGDVARANPDVTFYAYTRSWRIAAILDRLRAFAAMPNVWLWFSEDRDTGISPAVPRVRRAFLVLDESDVARIDPGVDLVFRDGGKSVAKRLGGAQVCPYEDNVARKAGRITCTKCGICYGPPKRKKAGPCESSTAKSPRLATRSASTTTARARAGRSPAAATAGSAPTPGRSSS